MTGGTRVRSPSFWVAASFAASLSACSLPAQQLNLPSPTNGLSGGGGTFGTQGGPGPASQRDAQIFHGSGDYTASLPSGAAQSGRARSREGGDGISLELAGASVPEAAKTILGDLLRVNYTISDKVKASITLSTVNPVSKEQLLTIFEAVLQSEGVKIVEADGVFHILPADASVGSGTRWASRRGQRVGAGTSIVALRYVSAAEMERIIKAVAPQANILRADAARNLLLVSGSRDELQSISETVETFDVDWMRGMSFALIPVESADPEILARELETVFGQDGESPVSGVIRFIPNTRLKAVLIISSRPEYLERAAGWAKRIDLAGQATEKQVHVYRVKNRAASELAVLLRRVYASQAANQTGFSASTQPDETAAVLTSGRGSDDIPPDQGLPAALAIAQGAAPRVFQSAAGPQPADRAFPDDSRPGGGGIPGASLSVVADDANNSLIITATPGEYRKLQRVLASIDVAASQVLLEATIAEVTLTDRLKFGLKWFFEAGANTGTFTTDRLGDVISGFPGFSYFLNTPNVQVALDALNSVTTVNLVSSPSLMVLDNKKAVLQIGDEVPIATQQATSVLTPGAPIVNSISFRSTGVILGITPRIGDNGRIQLDIEQEVSDVKRTDTSDLDSPTISQRRVRTTVAVGDGESIVLAGLMRDRSQVLQDKVPLMGDIPVVGNLFKSKDDDIARTELLIAITPHIVNDPRQIRSITQEFRDRLNFTTRPQRTAPPDKRENVDRLLR